MHRLILAVSFPLLAVAVGAKAEPRLVECPAEAPVVQRYELKEKWRIDPDDSESPLLGYSYRSQVCVKDGRVYLLDAQLCYIFVFSEDGDYLGSILGEGDGPGEVRRPGEMFFCHDGRIAVKFGYPTMLEFVDTDGTPRGRWRIGCNAYVNRLQETPLGWFAVYGESKQSEEPGVFLSIFHAAVHDGNGDRVFSFFEKEHETRHGGTAPSEADEYNPWVTAVYVGDDQVVLSAARDEYRLEWKNRAGETIRVATREYPAHVRTRDELEQIKYSSYSIINGDFRFKERKLSKRDPMINAIDPLPDGALRIRTSLFAKDLPENMVCRYEIHEPTGELRESVEIIDPTGAFDVDYDDIALLEDGTAMVLRNIRPAYRVATDAGLHPDRLAKMPPIPDERKDMAFTPVFCELVEISDR